MADRPDMFGTARGFSGMADSMESCKMLWADPYCHGNEIWTSRGDHDAYWLVVNIICNAICHQVRLTTFTCGGVRRHSRWSRILTSDPDQHQQLTHRHQSRATLHQSRHHASRGILCHVNNS